MARIITESLIRSAVEFARPSAQKVLDSDTTIWGPRWVEVLVDFENRRYGFQIGAETAWDSSWGEEISLKEIAITKLDASSTTGHPTRHLVHTAPHLLREGEYLYVGSVTWERITVAVSGAESAADEAIALTVLAMIKMLIFLEAERRQREGEDRI